ncbi:MAG: hypothetical protein NT150_00405 [Bacteroidetes bacterium]|nr:hypothetical protein [Bacteroidota bacterium]
MKNYLLSILLLAVACFANAQTNIGGTLSSNTTLTKINSPYQLTSTLGIPSAVTLTIEPGVVISGSFDVLIKGKLIAAGNAINKITFNNVRILFKSTNLSNSQISYADFNSGGIQLADEDEFHEDAIKNSGTLTVSNLNIVNGFAYSKGYNTTASFKIRNSSFNTSSVQGFYPLSETIKFSGCQILNTSILSDSYNKGIYIDSSAVESSKLMMGCCGSYINVTNSVVKSSSGTPGGVSSDTDGAFFITKNSIFINSPLTYSGATVNLENTLVFNDGQKNVPAISFRYTTIKNSSFFGAKNSISLYQRGLAAITSSIIQSNFYNDSIAIVAEQTKSLSISDCNFMGQSKYTIQNNSTTNISALNNFWSKTNSSAIISMLYDSHNNINLGDISFSPFKTIPNTLAPSLIPNGLSKKDSLNGVVVKWNKNKESGVAGYKLYYGTFDGINFSNSVNVGSDTSYFLTGKNTSDLILVTAYDSLKDGLADMVEGHESWYSQDIVPVAKISNGDSLEICKGSKIIL